MSTPLSPVQDGLTEAEAALALATLKAAGIEATLKVSTSPFAMREASIYVPASSALEARTLLAAPRPSTPSAGEPPGTARFPGLRFLRGAAFLGAAGSVAAVAYSAAAGWRASSLLLLAIPGAIYLIALVRLRAVRCGSCGYRPFPVLGSSAALFAGRCPHCGRDL